VDEAGAGPLAGPVAAAAVILPVGLIIDGADDSKKLNEKKRNRLAQDIKAKALAYSIVFIDNNEIDKINILQARLKAMALAVSALEPKADFAYIDGHILPPSLGAADGLPAIAIKGGDAKNHLIACASILAKVARDEAMLDYHKTWPEYGFDRHKGYGTKAHFAALKEYGPCPIHRLTFL
jgi:ribonuclease HII